MTDAFRLAGLRCGLGLPEAGASPPSRFNFLGWSAPPLECGYGDSDISAVGDRSGEAATAPPGLPRGDLRGESSWAGEPEPEPPPPMPEGARRAR